VNYERKTRNILYCDQSNVLLARITFSGILLTAFWFFFSHRKWRHRSREHSTLGARLFIGCP